jgi:predicted Fe-Mo cluster-binding NifX family protein
MKIAVSSSGNDLGSQVDPRFGRCAYFVIVETDDMGFEAFENGSIALGGGAGIQAAQFVASKGAKAVITGNVGPNAVQTLSAAGVETFVGQSGTVREAIERHTKGDINSTSTPNVADHYGMGSRAGMGRGMDMGRGRGMARSTFGGSSQPAPPALSKENELKGLKDKANEMRKQIEGIEASINALEKK